LTIESLIATCSAIAALISALFAIRSTQIAKRALLIAEKEYNSKKEGLNIYLIEGVNYLNPDEGYIFAFNTSVTNQATLANTIKRIELIITFIREDETIGNSIIQHDSSLCESIAGHHVSPFQLPMEIQGKSAQAGWFLFSLSRAVRKFGRIDKYTLRVTDTQGNVTEATSYLIKEYRNA
jgi:hypothetical protein